MIFSNYKSKFIKKGFTIIEVVIVTVIISTWMMGMISVINYGNRFSERTRSQTVATNLARQWIEWVLNIRDTNWKRRSGRRDECWLLENPSLDGSGCEEKAWMQSGSYIINLTWTAKWQKYHYLSWVDEALNISNWIGTSDRKYALCHNDKWEPCPWDDNPTPEGRFFREIDVKWLYDKNEGTPNDSLECDNWNECWDSRAKELRFCSRVEFEWSSSWQTELCSIITNFRR